LSIGKWIGNMFTLEPMLPTRFREQLEPSAVALIRESGALASGLRARTRDDHSDTEKGQFAWDFRRS